MIRVLLSFCIPTFNRANQAYNLVKEIVRFQSDQIEIVVSDNASSDETQELIKSIDDSRVKYFQNKTNFGYEANLLLSIKRATGKFIFTLMDDDKVEIETLPWILKNIQKNSKLTQLCGQLGDERPKIEKRSKYFTSFNDKYLIGGLESLKELLFYYPHSSGVVLRKDVLNLNSAFKCIGYYNVGTLFICELLIAQAMITGDTLCTSKVFTYIMSDTNESSVRKCESGVYWHPNGRLFIIKFKNYIIKYLKNELKNFKKLKKTVIKWQRNNVVWCIGHIPYFPNILKNLIKGLSVVIGMKYVSSSPLVWIKIIANLSFNILNSNKFLKDSYDAFFVAFHRQPQLIRSF